MSSYSADDAKKRYEKLPPEVKELLYSPKMSFTIQQIGQKNKLHIDQIDILNTETGQLMLGFIESKDFPGALMEMLNLDRVAADALVQDISDMLLAPIREAMKKVYEQNTTPAAPAVQNPSAVDTPSIPNTPARTTSVVMPSSATLPTPPLVTKTLPVIPPTPMAKPPAASAPAPMHAADMMLSQPTVSMPVQPSVPQKPTPPITAPPAPSTPPTPSTPKIEVAKPPPYKADPYREPAE